MRRFHNTAVPAVLLIAALAFRLMLATGWPNDEPDDGRYYSLIARNVVTAGVYSGSSGPPIVPTYARVPGYPLLIAGAYRLFGVNNNTAVRVIQAIIETATCWSIACLALALAPRRWPTKTRTRIQRATLAIAAVCPFTAVYVTTLLTEVTAIALGTALAWFAARAIGESAPGEGAPGETAPRPALWWWLAAGIAGGGLTMVRPECGLLTAGAGVTLILVALLRRRVEPGRWTGVAKRIVFGGVMLSLGFLVLDGPWIVRNYVVFGAFQPIAPSTVAMPGEFVPTGYPRWLSTWVNEPKYVGPFEFDQDRARFSVDRLPPWAIDSPNERQFVAELFAVYNDGPGALPSVKPAPDTPPAGLTPELDEQFAALAAARIQRHPVRHYLLLPSERLFRMWAGPHAEYYPFEGDLLPLANLDHDTNQHVWLPLFAALTLIWTIFGVSGGLRLLREPGARAGLLLLILLTVPRLLLLGSMENPEPRYMVELFPFLSALGGIAIGAVGHWRHDELA